MTVKGYAPCYQCGYGHQCVVGAVVKKHGFLEKITADHLPPRFEEQCNAGEEAKRLGSTLRGILK